MPPSSQSELDQNIAQVMQMLPPPVQDYLASGKYSLIAKDLSAKHGLSIDQSNILEREIMLLLMGIENPSEFMTTLTSEAAIPQQMVQDIMMEISQRIFISLQEEMRKGIEMLGQQPPKIPTPPPSTPQPMAPPVSPPIAPRVEILLEPSVIIPANPRLPPRPGVRPAVEIKWIRPLPKTNAPVPNYVPPRPAEVRQQMNEGGPRPVVTETPKPVEDEKLLEDHEEPHLELGVRDKVQDISDATQDANLPVIQPQAPAPPTSSPLPPSSPAQPYSVDPYREPIDEN